MHPQSANRLWCQFHPLHKLSKLYPKNTHCACSPPFVRRIVQSSTIMILHLHIFIWWHSFIPIFLVLTFFLLTKAHCTCFSIHSEEHEILFQCLFFIGHQSHHIWVYFLCYSGLLLYAFLSLTSFLYASDQGGTHSIPVEPVRLLALLEIVLSKSF